MTLEHDDSDDEWESHRLALEKEARISLSHEHNEAEDGDEEDDHQPFVYPGVGASGSELPGASSSTSEENKPLESLSTEQVTSLEPEEFPAQTQTQSPELSQQDPLAVENPPPSNSSSSDILSEASPALPAGPQPPPPTLPSPAQLESLYAAASSGDLLLLKRLFKSAVENNDVQQFSLANDASTRTGYTALHASASKGHLHIVQWRKFVPCWFSCLMTHYRKLWKNVVLCPT
jgi:hypothetical protein